MRTNRTTLNTAALITLAQLGACAGPALDMDASIGEADTAATVRATEVYPEGPITESITIYERPTEADPEPLADPIGTATRLTSATAPDGSFRIVSLREEQPDDTPDTDRRVRDILLLRAPDGSVYLERVLSARDEDRGGRPFRYFRYEPPLLLLPETLQGGETIESESALIEVSNRPPFNDRGRGTVRRTVRVMSDEEQAAAFANTSDLGDTAYRETLDVRFSVANRREIMERLLNDAGAGVVTATESRLTILGVPSESKSTIEVVTATAPGATLPEEPRTDHTVIEVLPIDTGEDAQEN